MDEFMEISHKEKRRRLKAFWSKYDRVAAIRRRIVSNETLAERRADYFCRTGKVLPLVLPDYPEYPAECEDMTCGAKAKSTGEPCKSTQIFRNGRCLYHGGPSTGPKSDEGKLAALGNLKRGPEPHGMPDKS